MLGEVYPVLADRQVSTPTIRSRILKEQGVVIPLGASGGFQPPTIRSRILKAKGNLPGTTTP